MDDMSLVQKIKGEIRCREGIDNSWISSGWWSAQVQSRENTLNTSNVISVIVATGGTDEWYILSGMALQLIFDWFTRQNLPVFCYKCTNLITFYTDCDILSPLQRIRLCKWLNISVCIKCNQIFTLIVTKHWQLLSLLSFWVGGGGGPDNNIKCVKYEMAWGLGPHRICIGSTSEKGLIYQSL